MVKKLKLLFSAFDIYVVIQSTCLVIVLFNVSKIEIPQSIRQAKHVTLRHLPCLQGIESNRETVKLF